MEYLVNRLLERSAVKVARSVLRGGRWSNPSVLPDKGLPRFSIYLTYNKIIESP